MIIIDSLPGTPVFPVGSFEITNPGGSTSNIDITMMGSDTTITNIITESDGGRIEFMQTITSLSISSRVTPLNSPSASTFDIETQPVANIFSRALFRINNQSIVTIATEDNVLRQTGSGDVVEYQGGAAILSNPNISVSISENSNSFWYISPLGIAYEFNGDKITEETGEGVFFVDSANTAAIFSQYQPASDVLLSNIPNHYQIQTVESNQVLLRLNSVREFFIQNASRLTTSGEVVRFENGQFITGSGSFPASFVYIIGSTGFEAFAAAGGQFETSTFVSNYDAIFYNAYANNILVSTSPVLSQQVMEGQAHLSEGNAAANELTFNRDARTIEYNGIQLLNLANVLRTNFGSDINIIYSGNKLFYRDQEMNDQVLNTGVKQMFFQQPNGFSASLARFGPIFRITAGGVFFSDNQGNTLALNSEFSDSISFVDMAIATPELPTAPPSAMFTLYRQGQLVFLRINGMNVLEATNSNCQDRPITTTDTVTYNNGVISLTTQGMSISGVNMFTVASSGENVLLLTNTVTGFSIDVDSFYTLTTCGDQAVLTNTAGVQSMITSANSLVGVVEENGVRTLFIGSTAYLTLNGNVQLSTLGSNSSVRYRFGTFIVFENGVESEVTNSIGTLGIFQQSDTNPIIFDSSVDTGMISSSGMLYVGNGMSFITDIPMINDVLANELATGFAVQSNSFNQRVLVADSSDVMILNGVGSLVISGDQNLRYIPSTNQLQIRDSSNTILETFTNVNNVRTSLQGGPGAVQNLQTDTIINGPLRLYTQRRLGDYFITNNPIIQGLVSGAIPVPSLSLSAVDGGNNNILLTIGNDMFLVNDDRDISSGSSIQYDNSMITIGSETISGIDELLVYTDSDAMLQSNTGSSANIDGPGMLYLNDQSALFTDREDVMTVVDSITPVIPSAVSTRTDSDGRVQLIVGGQDVIALNERPIENIASTSTVQFSGSSVTITMADNTMMQFPITTFTSYLTTNTAPQDVSAPQTFTGSQGRLVLTGDTAFFTDRPEVISVIDMPVSLFTTVGPVPDRQLIVGGDNIIRLSMSARVDARNGEQIVISGTTVTVVDSNTNSVLRTFTGLGNITRYLGSDDRPVSISSDATIAGPATILADLDRGDALITNRQEVTTVINTVITPEERLAVSTRTDSDGRVQLIVGGQDVIALNERPIENIASTSTVQFSGSSVTITMADNTMMQFPITTFTSYLTTNTAPQDVSAPQTFTGSQGRLVLTGDTAFFTDRPEVISVIDMPVSLFTTVGPVPDRQLIVGGDNIIRLSMSARVDARNGEQIVISGTTVTVVDSNTNSVLRTFTGLGNITRYLGSDDRPVSNSGDATIMGPATIVADLDRGDALITNRQEVIRGINTVIMGTALPTLDFGLREDGNRTILVIDMMDIVTVNEGIIRQVTNVEEIMFNSPNMVVVRNFISGMESGSMVTTRLIRYLTSDAGPITFTNTDTSFKGPATSFYQHNQAPSTVFVTDRPEIAMLLMSTLDNLTAMATPAPVTPQPATTKPPVAVDFVNNDGTRWTTGLWSAVSLYIIFY